MILSLKYTQCTNPYGLLAMEYKNKTVSTNFSSDTMFPRIHSIVGPVVVYSEAQIHTFAVYCVCTHSEAIHLVQGAVALATINFQYNLNKKNKIVISV